MMKLIWITFLIVVACSPKKTTNTESIAASPPINEPSFSSEKFDVNFPSFLPQETLKKAGTFADNQMESVVLMSLLPDCQVQEGEERCYETTVLSSYTGDSLQMEHRPYLDSVLIDADRFGMAKTLEVEDIKKLLPALFTSDKKEDYSFCYNPRHAIAIFNPDKQMKGFIELCFECSESITIINSIELPDLSQNALNEIGALFLAYGFEEKQIQSD
ncbi:MAG: hypothetical protein R8G66_23445 [Cytophagales bacterium]|nr:hypothetical protein [Cytophagales bacterium]